jgi:hypothetical protein
LKTLHDELLAVMERRETAILLNSDDKFTTPCPADARLSACHAARLIRVAHSAIMVRLYSLIAVTWPQSYFWLMKRRGEYQRIAQNLAWKLPQEMEKSDK